MSSLPLPSDKSESIDRLAELVAQKLNGEDSSDRPEHPLDTIEVKHFSGSDRYAVLYLGERVKQVSYQNSRSQKDAEAIAKRIAEGVRNAVSLMISQ